VPARARRLHRIPASNGFTVTASAPHTSKRPGRTPPRCCRFAPLGVEISSRLSGTIPRTRSSTRSPSDPCCSKKARLGLTATTGGAPPPHLGAEALELGGIPHRGSSRAEGDPARDGGGQADGEGLSAHQTSRAVLGWIAPWSARERRDVDPIFSVEAQRGRHAPSGVEDHRGQPVDGSWTAAVVTRVEDGHGLASSWWFCAEWSSLILPDWRPPPHPAALRQETRCARANRRLRPRRAGRGLRAGLRATSTSPPA